MPDPQQKLVKVPDVGVVAFPQDMHDDHIAAAIKKHQERLSPTPSIGNDGKLSSSPPASSPTLAQTDNTVSYTHLCAKHRDQRECIRRKVFQGR